MHRWKFLLTVFTGFTLAHCRGGAMPPGGKGGVSYPQIVAYLESIGAKKKEIDRTPQTKEALQQLASKHGGNLADTEAVRKADAEKKQAIENNKIAAREKKIRPLSEAALRRYRLAFDHFDEDDSGELDKVEFRKAMIDSGMMPLGFEVNEMFIEADTDGNGTVSFDEYCRFVQVRKPSLRTPAPHPPRALTAPRLRGSCTSRSELLRGYHGEDHGSDEPATIVYAGGEERVKSSGGDGVAPEGR